MKKAGQNVTHAGSYIPTKAEFRLLELMMNPFWRKQTVSQICRRAQISRMTFYRILEKPEFMAFYREASAPSREIIVRNMGPLVNTIVREAVRGNLECAKIGLGLAGIYTQKRKIIMKSNPEAGRGR